MGDWRTVRMEGTLPKEEVKAFIEYLMVPTNQDESPASEQDDVFYLQMEKAMFGLKQWIREDGRIHAIGSVYERNCEIKDLHQELTAIAKRFPNLNMILHAGCEYESPICETSFKVANGNIEQVEPLIERVD